MGRKCIINLVLIGVLILCNNLNVLAQKKAYLNPKDTMDLSFEKFDTDFYNKNKSKRGELDFFKKLEDRTEIEISGSEILGSIEQRESPPPFYFIKVKRFYINGNLREKGILLDNCKIGKWLECDENGSCKIEDYEKNRGRFGYNDVLRFLEKKKFISPKKETGRGRFTVSYNYENSFWIVSGTHNETLWTIYYLDGNTGKILKEFQPPIIF